MLEQHSGYRLLPNANTDSSPSGINEELDKEVYAARLNSMKVGPTSSSLWAIFVCLLCTVVNLGLIHASSRTSSPSPVPISALTRQDLFKLRRPSQYIRLDEIPRPSLPVARQFNNYPIAVGQVDSASPHKVIDGAAHMHMVHSGTIIPEEARVHVSSTVTTIVQFRAIDFGMERCDLQLMIQPQALARSSKPFTLEIFRLNATLPLDTQTLTYNTRPPRMSKVAAVELSDAADTHWSRSFACASDEILTFEVACLPTLDDGQCRVEWWQTKSNPQTAIFITQHATV